MKSFAIIGTGAVGSYYGGRLAQAGNKVRFLLRSDYEIVREQGLKVESIHGDFQLPEVSCAQTPEEIGPVDIVIIAWKTTANEYFDQTVSPLLHEGTVILTLQNGLGNVEQLGEIFGSERVLGALCFVCINRLAPGVISHTGGGNITVGESSPGITPRLKELVGIFNEAGVRTEAVSNLGEAQWRKLVWNVPFNGLCITEGGIDTEVLLALRDGETRVRELMIEVLLGADALGFEIEEEFSEVQIKRTYPMGPYRPSSMIDFVEHRPVEVEAIWGEPLRRAEAVGAELPKMRALYEQILTLTVRGDE